jgi:cytochrome c-type biogenesis protein CcmE
MLLVMVAGIVSLFLFAFKPAAIYSMPLEQLLAAAEDNTGRRVRIEGELVPGTLVKRDSPCEFRFSMRGTEARDQKISVRFPQCIVPDTFRDVPEGGVMVTAEGTLGEDGSFEATHIMAKCSSKYNAETHAMEGPTDSAVAPPADPYE